MEPFHFEYSNLAEPSPSVGKTLLQIKRVGICGTDLHAYDGTQPFFSYPRILGHEIAAEVVQSDNPEFTPHTSVTVIPYFHCGHCLACRHGKTNCCVQLKVFGVHMDGAMAEFVSVPTSHVIAGKELSLDELALLEPLAIGAHGVRRAGVMPGEFVLVVGAGPIGLCAMHFARISGARVVAMDTNLDRLAFCEKKLKVEAVVQAGAGALEQISALTHGEMPSVVIDATGSQKAINGSFPYMAHGGRYVLIGLQKGDVTFSHPEFHKREGTLMSSRNATLSDFTWVMENVRNGNIRVSDFITHRAPFVEVKSTFESWSDPKNGVIKAMVAF